MEIKKIVYKNKQGNITDGLFTKIIGGYREVKIGRDLINFFEIISENEIQLNPISGRIQSVRNL